MNYFEQVNQPLTPFSGYSGADMRQMCAEASMGPIRDVENSSTMDIETVEAEQVGISDYEI